MVPLRRLLLPLLALLSVLALAGCGSDDDAPAASTSGTASSGAFPATIEHKYGSTTVESAPKRVVVVGLREQDDLISLGVVPVGTTEWFGEDPGALGSWARAKIGSAALPTVLTNTDGVDVEKVASLRPDLIVGIYSGITRAEYGTLSKIAPTIAQPKGVVDYGSTWEQELEMVGAAVGKADEARRQRDAVRARVREAAAQHPEFAGKTAAVATPYEGTYVYGPQDSRSRFLTDLGFAFPPALRDVGGEEFGGDLSQERLDELDLDTVLWLTEGAASRRSIERNPVYRELPVRREGRDIFIDAADGVLYDGFSKTSVLTVPLLLDGLVPRLAQAVDRG